MEQNDVDEIMCIVQGAPQKAQAKRFHTLSVRVGMARPPVRERAEKQTIRRTKPWQE